MKKLAIAMALTLGLITTPALAQSTFTGVRAEARTNFDDNIGGAVGADIAATKNLRLGLEADADFRGADRFNFSTRAGYVMGPLMPYAKIGVTDSGDLTYGGGAEVALNQNMYVNAEYRRNNETKADGLLVGLGLRF